MQVSEINIKKTASHTGKAIDFLRGVACSILARNKYFMGYKTWLFRVYVNVFYF